jgi:hypothetical protein
VSLVVDASVALKWFLAEEPPADRALAILRDGPPLIAPDVRLRVQKLPPHPNPLPASGEREGPAEREGEGQATDLGRFAAQNH